MSKLQSNGRKESTKFTVVSSQPANRLAATSNLQNDNHNAIIDLEDSSEDLEPSQKRARLESHASAGPSNAVDSSPKATKGSSDHSKGGEQTWIPPFSLLKVQGIPNYGNRFALLHLHSFA